MTRSLGTLRSGPKIPRASVATTPASLCEGVTTMKSAKSPRASIEYHAGNPPTISRKRYTPIKGDTAGRSCGCSRRIIVPNKVRTLTPSGKWVVRLTFSTRISTPPVLKMRGF